MYCKGLNLIYIPIRKTGCTSIRESLSRYCDDSEFPERFSLGCAGWDWELVKELMNNPYVLASVRNPFSRMVSNYTYTEFGKDIWGSPVDFETFVEKSLDGFLEEPWSEHIYMTCSDYLYTKSGRLVADKILRQETLDEDWVKFAEQKELNPHLEVRNKSHKEHDHYSRYYTYKAIEMVGKHFRRDLNNFGYTFEDLTR